MRQQRVSPVEVGDVLADKYRVERIIGVGGMGVVAEVSHLELEQRYAIKFMLPEIAKFGEAVERFMREARAAARLKSEHVGRIFDVGRLESGAPYMVMELLGGVDLEELLEKSGRLPIESAVSYVLQACVALAEAHVAGIVHRDLKPANLFLSSRPDGSPIVKVLDFGVSKVKRAPGNQNYATSLTATSTMLGSPTYMAPEQMRSSKSVDARADVWALGVSLFQLLAGRPPFVADALPVLCLEICNDPAPSLVAFRPDVPPALEDAILQCLEKDPDRRPSTVADLALSLWPFAPREAFSSVQQVVGVMRSAGMTNRQLPAFWEGERKIPTAGELDATALASPGVRAGHPALPASPPMISKAQSAPGLARDLASQSRTRWFLVALLGGLFLLIAAVSVGVVLGSGQFGKAHDAATAATGVREETQPIGIAPDDDSNGEHSAPTPPSSVTPAASSSSPTIQSAQPPAAATTPRRRLPQPTAKPPPKSKDYDPLGHQ